MAYDDRRSPSPACSAFLADSPAWLALTPAQIASWSLTPDLPDTSSTFVDVLELTDDDLRWLRRRPCSQSFVVDDSTGEVPSSLSLAAPGHGSDLAAPVVTEPVVEPFWATPGVTPPSAPVAVSPRVAAAQDGISALIAGGPVSGSRADTEALLRLAEQARSVALRELAEMDATGGHLSPDVRATTTGSWLRDALHLGDAAARAMVRTAVRLRDELPALGALMAEGAITSEHAQAALAGVRGLDPQVITAASDGICNLAGLVDPASARRILRDKAVAVDPRLAEEAARRTKARQGVRVSEVGDHTALDGTLSGEDGELLRRALALGTDKARTEGDTRSRAARNADVLLDWARWALAREHGPGDSLREDARTIRTHLHVLVTPDQLAAATRHINNVSRPVVTGRDGSRSDAPPTAHQAPVEPGGLDGLLGRDLLGMHTPAAPVLVGSSTPLTLAALRRLACDATMHLTVQQDLRDGGDGEHACDQRPPGARSGTSTPPGWLCSHRRDPLYVGRSARTITGAQLKALIARDRGCVVKGCHVPPPGCEGHHVEHWLHGGQTNLDDLVLLCGGHHHDHHDREKDLPHRDGTRWITQNGWATDQSLP